MKNTENNVILHFMQFPPENFENLRQFSIMFRHGEIELDMGKKSLSALLIMVDNPDRVATSTISELATFVKISPASITRLAKLLGFKGYQPFRQIFRQSAKIKTDYYSQRAVDIVHSTDFSPKEFLLKQARSTLDNIQQCLQNTTNEEIKKICKLLAIKRNIFVFGHQQSSAIASILRYGLSLIRKNVQMLGPSEHGVATAVGQMREGDLLIIISSSPYSHLTVDIASLASKQGCQIIAITDSKLSPLHERSCASINIATEGHYFTNSLAANCILVESLLSLTAMELGQAAIDKLKQHEDLLSTLNVNA